MTIKQTGQSPRDFFISQFEQMNNTSPDSFYGNHSMGLGDIENGNNTLTPEVRVGYGLGMSDQYEDIRKTTRPRPPSKMPGYVEPGRKGTVSIAAHVAPALRDAINVIARMHGQTTQNFLTDILTGVVNQMRSGSKQEEAIAATLDQYSKALEQYANALGQRGASRPRGLQAPPKVSDLTQK